MKTLLLYDKPVALDRTRHRALRLRQDARPFGFARETNSVLLAATELTQACLDYPCVFVATKDGHALSALVGLRDRENLFVDASGQWQPGSYVPAFVRRYPFVLAESGPQETMAVCVDESYAGLNESEGEALFEADGGDSAWLRQMQTFMLDFHRDMTQGQAFIRRMAELDLLVERQVRYEVDGHASTLTGFKLIDEQKLRALPAETVQELFQAGWLGLAYAQLISMAQVPRLAGRLGRHLQAEAVEAAAAIPPVQVRH